MTKLRTALPKDDLNGLEVVTRAVIADPSSQHVIVALVDCSKVTRDIDTGDTEVTLRIRRVEGIVNATDQRAAWSMLEKQFEERTGRTALPLDIDDEPRPPKVKAKRLQVVDRDADQGDR